MGIFSPFNKKIIFLLSIALVNILLNTPATQFFFSQFERKLYIKKALGHLIYGVYLEKSKAGCFANLHSI